LNSGRLPKFHAIYSHINQLERSLARAINWLRPTHTEIDSPLFDSESKLKANVFIVIQSQTMTPRLSRLAVYGFFENYKSIIETNFPTLKQYFRMYSKLPIRLFGNRNT